MYTQQFHLGRRAAEPCGVLRSRLSVHHQSEVDGHSKVHQTPTICHGRLYVYRQQIHHYLITELSSIAFYSVLLYTIVAKMFLLCYLIVEPL